MAVTSAVSAELIGVSSLLYVRFHSHHDPHAVLIQAPLQRIRVRTHICRYSEPCRPRCIVLTSSSLPFMCVCGALHSNSLYRTYFRPKATSAEIVRVSHYFICFWAVWAGCWATIVRLLFLAVFGPIYVSAVLTDTCPSCTKQASTSGGSSMCSTDHSLLCRGERG